MVVRRMTGIALALGLALGLALQVGPAAADQGDPRPQALFARPQAAPDASAAQAGEAPLVDLRAPSAPPANGRPAAPRVRSSTTSSADAPRSKRTDGAAATTPHHVPGTLSNGP